MKLTLRAIDELIIDCGGVKVRGDQNPKFDQIAFYRYEVVELVKRLEQEKKKPPRRRSVKEAYGTQVA